MAFSLAAGSKQALTAQAAALGAAAGSPTVGPREGESGKKEKDGAEEGGHQH